VDFLLSAEQEMFKQSVREFAEKNIAPRSREIDRNAAGIPEEIIQGMAKLGLFGLTIPEKYGGSAIEGEEIVTAMLAVHEIARAELSMSLPVYYLLNLGWSYLVSRFGTEELKKEILPRVATGEWFLGIATTESSGGSDLARIKTNAAKRDRKYILNGEKYFVSGVEEGPKRGGGHCTLFRTGTMEDGNRALTFAYVPAQARGIAMTPLHMMGRMGLSTGVIHYDGVEIPEHYRLGDENKGFYTAMQGFNAARVLVCAACTGGAERALELTRDYTTQRHLFGTPLAKFEGISFEIADDWAKLEMLKNTLLKTAWMIDRHHQDSNSIPRKDVNAYVAMCKMIAPHLGLEITKHAIMHHGALGYSDQVPFEMLMRGLMSYVAGAEGGTNVMKIIIAREFIGDVAIPY